MEHMDIYGKAVLIIRGRLVSFPPLLCFLPPFSRSESLQRDCHKIVLVV